MRRLSLFAVVLVTAAGGCGGCGKQETRTDATVDLPVPPPANLLAEGAIPTPDSTWARVQRGVGGMLAIMAPTVGGLAASLAGAEPWLGAEIDGGSPAYVVIGGSPVAGVVSLRLRSASHAREVLATDSGRFHAAGEKDGLAFFEPTGNGFALGVASSGAGSGWIVFGKTKDAVVALGPYAYRTMPTKPQPKANLHFDVLHAGFAGWLVPFAQTKWTDAKAFLIDKDTEARAAHGGREPDFGDARAVVSILDGWITARTDAAADVTSGALDFDVKDDRITGTLALEPGAGASKAMAESMRPGPIALGAMPQASIVVAVRDDLAGRKDTAKTASEGIVKILGKRLSAADAKQIGSALDGFASARGDWLAVAGQAANGSLLFRTPAGEHATEATKELVALADKPAFRTPFDVLTGGAKNPIAWSVKDGAVRIAVAAQPQAILDDPADDDRWAKAFDAVGETSFVVAGHAAGKEGERDAISTLATKRRDNRIEVALDANPVVVRDVLKALIGAM